MAILMGTPRERTGEHTTFNLALKARIVGMAPPSPKIMESVFPSPWIFSSVDDDHVYPEHALY